MTMHCMYAGPISVSAFEVMNAALPIFSQWEDVAGLWWGRLLQAIEAAIRCRLDCTKSSCSNNTATMQRELPESFRCDIMSTVDVISVIKWQNVHSSIPSLMRKFPSSRHWRCNIRDRVWLINASAYRHIGRYRRSNIASFLKLMADSLLRQLTYRRVYSRWTEPNSTEVRELPYSKMPCYCHGILYHSIPYYTIVTDIYSRSRSTMVRWY